MKAMVKNVLTRGLVLYGAAAGTMATVMAQNPFDTVTKNTGSGKFGGAVRGGNLGTIVMSLIQNALTLLGILAVLIIIWSGVQLILSQGNDEALKKAKKTLMMAAAGFALIILSWSIVGFILSILGGDTTAVTEFTK